MLQFIIFSAFVLGISTIDHNVASGMLLGAIIWNVINGRFPLAE